MYKATQDNVVCSKAPLRSTQIDSVRYETFLATKTSLVFILIESVYFNSTSMVVSYLL